MENIGMQKIIGETDLNDFTNFSDWDKFSGPQYEKQSDSKKILFFREKCFF